MLASVFCKSANAMDWWGVTEDFPPYNYVEDKKPTGFATEVVQQLMAKLDEDIRIDVLPWTRAMLTAESRPDTLIFSILRTDTRENKYHWIGQIDNLSIYLWQLHDNHLVIDKAPMDITYGVIRSLDDNILGLLATRYFINSEKIVTVEKGEQLLGLLLKGRVDRIVMAENAWGDLEELLSPEQVRRMQRYDLLVQRNLYVAASSNTSEEKVAQLKQAYEELSDSPSMRALRQKYGLDRAEWAP